MLKKIRVAVAALVMVTSQTSAGQVRSEARPSMAGDYCTLLEQNKLAHENLYQSIVDAAPYDGSQDDLETFVMNYSESIDTLKRVWKDIDAALLKKDIKTCKRQNEDVWDILRSDKIRKLANQWHVEDQINWKLMLVRDNQ